MSLCGLKKKSYNHLTYSRPASSASNTSNLTNFASNTAPVPVTITATAKIPALRQSKWKSIQRQPSIFKFREEFQRDAEDEWPLSPTKSANSYDDTYDNIDIHSIYRNEPQLHEPEQYLRRRRSSDLRWQREQDQLSVILETLSETGSTRRSREQTWDSEDLAEVLEFPARHNVNISSQPRIRPFKKTRFEDSIPEHEDCDPEPTPRRMSVSDRGSKGDTPRPIAPPPRDVSYPATMMLRGWEKQF